jgi:hypothetical protein
MIISKVKKLYPQEFLEKIKYSAGRQFVEDFKKTYYWQQLSTAIFEEDFYVRDYPKNKPKLRITFLPFLICILILNVVSLFKYLFTGSFRFSEKNLILRKMIAWDKYCRFNIIS